VDSIVETVLEEHAAFPHFTKIRSNAVNSYILIIGKLSGPIAIDINPTLFPPGASIPVMVVLPLHA
jgi:hypothetical protein